jgi:hypothetical protein
MQVTSDYVKHRKINWPNSPATERVCRLALTISVIKTLRSDKHLTTYSEDVRLHGSKPSQKVCFISPTPSPIFNQRLEFLDKV